MKIELKKETNFDSVWYWTYIDEHPDKCFYENEQEKAEARYKALIENQGKPPIIEVLKQTEI